MLFGREYMPEGAGVAPDAPRKKGAARLWEILSRDLDGIFLSGALAMLACAPAAILAGIALWLGSLPLCLLAAAAAGWLVGPALKELLAIDRQAGVKAGLQGSMTKMIRCVKPLLTMLMRPNIVRNH